MGNKDQSQTYTLATVIDQPINREFMTFKCPTTSNKELSRFIKIFRSEFHDVHDSTPCLSVEDRQFLDILKAQTTLQNGRVTMPSPFKTKPAHINTKAAALHRFKLLA